VNDHISCNVKIIGLFNSDKLDKEFKERNPSFIWCIFIISASVIKSSSDMLSPKYESVERIPFCYA